MLSIDKNILIAKQALCTAFTRYDIEYCTAIGQTEGVI